MPRSTTPKANAAHGGRTSITLRAMRADALHRLLLTPRGRVEHASRIPALPDLGSWAGLAIDVAVADLVADGRLSDDEHGRLVVAPLPRTAA